MRDFGYLCLYRRQFGQNRELSLEHTCAIYRDRLPHPTTRRLHSMQDGICTLLTTTKVQNI